jgi:hypothetical protein
MINTIIPLYCFMKRHPLAINETSFNICFAFSIVRPLNFINVILKLAKFGEH